MWRPKGWGQKRTDYLACKTVLASTRENLQIYEAGADAMLEALKSIGQYQKCIDQWDSEKPFTTGIGWLVIIPDEEVMRNAG